MRVAVIDSDTIMWVACYLANRDNLSEDQARENLDTYLTNMFKQINADKYVGFLGGTSGNFRKRMFPDYKANRPPVPDWIIKWKPIIKEHLMTRWKFVETVNEFEADDAVASVVEILKKQNSPPSDNEDNFVPIVCSPDKDLDQIPGEHYNTKTGESYVVNYPEARQWFCLQLLHGDNTDNIKAIKKGVGPVSAKKILEFAKDRLPTSVALEAFISEYGIYEGSRRFAENVLKVVLRRDNDYKFELHDVPNSSNTLFNIVS